MKEKAMLPLLVSGMAAGDGQSDCSCGTLTKPPAGADALDNCQDHSWNAKSAWSKCAKVKGEESHIWKSHEWQCEELDLGWRVLGRCDGAPVFFNLNQEDSTPGTTRLLHMHRCPNGFKVIVSLRSRNVF